MSLGFDFQAMACGCQVRLAGAGEDELAPLAHDAIAEVRRIETAYSRFREDSIVSRINAAAGGAAAIEVDDETAGLLNFAAQLHAQSGGLFDITSGVLRRAWNFRTGVLPSQEVLAQLLPRVGWSQVEWDGRRVRLPRSGMELDFGGFGKEYAADRAAAVLAERGAAHGFVNLGGDIRVIGPQADGRAWRFGIQHPRREDATIAGIALAGGALATSGDYERYFEHEGRRYCHILDPRSGWPAQHWQSISVVAPLAVAAGAMTTIAMLKGRDALDFLRAQGVGFLAVDAQGQVTAEGV
ncbi:FAD:protein FMN transferase [Piscinibacter sp. XHJ-5]|uniref:FAD:protein FMN transferase n=1 Tax=Piscinibacter sp. XHJ-5 TaxID=3037797 RepID=UPI002452F362|nr:FAD:protein FMN transferase [Piscinibacter sp. XHJ-5]